MAVHRDQIFTLGTSTRNAEEFIHLLRHYGIEMVVDVRRFPTSRFDHFVKENLASLLQEAGISYLYLGQELGGYRSGGYEGYMESEEFKGALDRLQGLAREGRVAVVCSERLPWRCHRRYIGRALQERGWRLRHIIDLEREWVPKEEQG